jgi:hypothetical protein
MGGEEGEALQLAVDPFQLHRRQAQRFLRQPPLGDVPQRAVEPAVDTLGVLRRDHHELGVEPGPVGPDDPDLRLDPAPNGQGGFGRRHPVEIVGVGEDCPRQPHHFRGGIAAEPGEGVVDPQEAAVEVEVRDALDGQFQGLPEAVPVLLDSPAVGVVAADSEDPGGFPGAVAVDALGGLEDAGPAARHQ